jgi:hypothetical protein
MARYGLRRARKSRGHRQVLRELEPSRHRYATALPPERNASFLRRTKYGCRPSPAGIG